VIRKKFAAALAGLALLVSGCASGTTSGPAPAPAQQTCAPGDDNYSWCVKATPQPTNPGVGHVSGACRFSVKGPAADTTRGSGLSTKRMSVHLTLVTGIVWGYCTDTIHDFTLDMYVYAAPAGDASGDFSQDPKAHQLSHKPWTTPPGPAPVPYPITSPCAPGLEYQLVFHITATDSAGNLIPGGPYGGQIVSFTPEQCGVSAK
jgi:hypothetical protein